MPVRRSSRKRNDKVVEAVREHQAQFNSYLGRLAKWHDLLVPPHYRQLIEQLVDILARLDLEPDQNGLPSSYVSRLPVPEKWKEEKRGGKREKEAKERWRKALVENLPHSGALNNAADLFARTGLDIDDQGHMVGEFPSLPKMDVIVLLESLASGTSVPGRAWGDDRQTSLTWKVDILNAATLIWAGAIKPTKQALEENVLTASLAEVEYLLEMGDLDGFWRRKHFSKTKKQIKEMHEKDRRFPVTEETLADMMRRYKRTA